MSVFVDPLAPCTVSDRWPHPESCHLVTDSASLDELHEFAGKIGLKREWFQEHRLMPHYDLSPAKRREAIKLGATAIPHSRLVKLIDARRDLEECVSGKKKLTDVEKRILRHMLGMEENPRRVWGYRNYYAAGRDAILLTKLRGMVNSGLLREGQTTEKLIYFHATEDGCRAMGLNTQERQRALEG